MQKHHTVRAFTLVELSIVLVILGLLIGGVLTGQSLIRAAELRSITTQHARFVTATHTFRDKYFALPGDITNATSYWGAAHATPTTCRTTASTSALTCNGDGNGQVDYAATAVGNESFRYWQHLANAGLIEGSYNGITMGTTDYTVTSANSPVGRIGSSLWFISYYGVLNNNPGQYFEGSYDHTFTFGAVFTNGTPANVLLKPEEAYNIDMKIDDGKPATGKLVTRTIGTWASQICTDATSSAQLSANYLLTSTAPGCAIMFRQAF